MPDNKYPGAQRKGSGTNIGDSRELYPFIFSFSLTRGHDNPVCFSPGGREVLQNEFICSASFR